MPSLPPIEGGSVPPGDDHSAERVHLHRIEVERDGEDCLPSVRFVCDGDDSALCHWYPDCECETWDDEHSDHPAVQQDSCWIDPWFNDALCGVGDWLDAWDGDTGDEPGLDDLVSGYVDTTFEGEWMTWRYAPCVSTPPATLESLECNAMGMGPDHEHDAHDWDFGSGETFRCPGDPSTSPETLSANGRPERPGGDD